MVAASQSCHVGSGIISGPTGGLAAAERTYHDRIGIVEHLAYDAAPGVVTAALVLDTGKRRAGAEGVFGCSTCRGRFASMQELGEHIRVAHHGVAA